MHRNQYFMQWNNLTAQYEDDMWALAISDSHEAEFKNDNHKATKIW